MGSIETDIPPDNSANSPKFIINQHLTKEGRGENAEWHLSALRQQAWLERSETWRDFDYKNWKGVTVLGAGHSGIW